MKRDLRLKGTVLYQDAEFGISLEEEGGVAICHCQVYSTTLGVLKRCKAQIELLHRAQQRDVYGVSERGDKKHHRFLKMVGFVPFRNKWILDENGDDKIISIWVRYKL